MIEIYFDVSSEFIRLNFTFDKIWKNISWKRLSEWGFLVFRIQFDFTFNENLAQRVKLGKSWHYFDEDEEFSLFLGSSVKEMLNTATLPLSRSL